MLYNKQWIHTRFANTVYTKFVNKNIRPGKARDERIILYRNYNLSERL